MNFFLNATDVTAVTIQSNNTVPNEAEDSRVPLAPPCGKDVTDLWAGPVPVLSHQGESVQGTDTP